MTRKPIQVFLLHAAFFLALLASLSGSREIYPRAFHFVGNFALASLGEGRSVRFQWADPDLRRDSADTRMLGRQRGDLKYRWRVIYSSNRRLFWPTATILALILATPMSRRRRIVVVPVAVVLFNAFYLLEVTGLSMALFGAVDAGVESGWIRQRGLPVAQALFNSPITNFSAAFFLWAWLAQPARGIDIGAINAATRLLLAPGGRLPEPPASAKEDDPT